MALSWEQIFPFLGAIAAALEQVRDLFFWIHSIAHWIFLALAIVLIAGYELQVRPKPKFVKYRFKWNARMVALYALISAVGVVIYAFGNSIWLIPGLMGIAFFSFYLLWVFPVVFGWPGIWAAATMEVLTGILQGWISIPVVTCAFAYDFFLGWFSWKTIGNDPSFSTKRSWLLFLLSYYPVYAFFETFGWGAQFVWWGMMPLAGMFMTRSAFNIIWYWIFSIMYPPVTAIIYRLAVRYRLYWKMVEPQPYVRSEGVSVPPPQTPGITK
jgi:hypothetical protein